MAEHKLSPSAIPAKVEIMSMFCLICLISLGSAARSQAQQTVMRKGKQPEDYLLTRQNGKPVRDLRGTWSALVEAAGLPGVQLHDFRRSAVRNMIRRGVPQTTARQISGHKTDSIFDRYNIVSQADIVDAARKIEAGAKVVLQSSRIVEPEGPSDENRQKDEKPIQSVS